MLRARRIGKGEKVNANLTRSSSFSSSRTGSNVSRNPRPRPSRAGRTRPLGRAGKPGRRKRGPRRVEPGDYVLVSAGLIVQRLDTEEAQERLHLLSAMDETPPTS